MIAFGNGGDGGNLERGNRVARQHCSQDSGGPGVSGLIQDQHVVRPVALLLRHAPAGAVIAPRVRRRQEYRRAQTILADRCDGN
jgi:hypothetical protein